MCGIAGYVLREGAADAPLVERMCNQIRHRGPDDAGYYTGGGCALGMRRLSIIDLITGHQPIANEDGTVFVVFNGEIYNYRELRRDLEGHGHRFTTASDTEALVHLYEQHGTDGLRRLRGMFAFAVWDSRQRRLLLARDAFGKKPLYYAALPGGLYFGSELKSLVAARAPREIDPEALRLYFQFGYIPEPYSVYRAVRKLAPGSWLEYQADGSLREGRYWRPPVAVAEDTPWTSEEDARQRVRDAFDEAVRMRRVADVPLGAFLSGGIDSSCVVASMARASAGPVKTFSIGFDDPRYNELHYARLVAEKYATDHHEIVVRPNALELLDRIVWHFDEPFGDSSALPTFIVSEFAARHVKVALSGDGGDEIFCGYDRLLDVEKLRRFDRLPRAARRALSAAAAALPYSAYGKNWLRMAGRESALERYLERNYTPYSLRKELLDPRWLLPAEEAHLRRALGDMLLDGSCDALSQAMFFEAAVNLPGDMLVKVDRMSMANSLEVRCPMLDTELAAVAASIPHAWRTRGGRFKAFLLDAVGDRLPRELLTRPKMGFTLPIEQWFRGELREFLWDHLAGPRFLARGYVRPAFMRGLLEEHGRGRRKVSSELWSLLMLELWHRQAESTPPAAAHA